MKTREEQQEEIQRIRMCVWSWRTFVYHFRRNKMKKWLSLTKKGSLNESLLHRVLHHRSLMRQRGHPIVQQKTNPRSEQGHNACIISSRDHLGGSK